MDLFGDKLKEIRLEKNFSLDQIARETKISKKFLEALEQNDFSVFPSETYLIGFLKSYTEYMGLDSSKYINQYRNYKIQEQPIPINELLDIKKSIHPVVVVLLIIVGVAIVAVSSILVYKYIFNPSAVTENTVPVEPVASEGEEYFFKDEVDTRWFSQADKIIVPLGDTEYVIKVNKIDESIELALGDQTKVIAPSDEVIYNFNNDDNADLKIVLNEVEETEGGKKAYLGLFKVTSAVTITEPIKEPVMVSSGTPAAKAGEVEVQDTAAAEGSDKVVLFETDDPAPFVINITFKGYCLFRYLLDDKVRNQKFFLKDDQLDIDVSRSVKLWISNAGSVKARISGKDVILGKAGQVVTKYLYWERIANTRKYHLVMVSTY